MKYGAGPRRFNKYSLGSALKTAFNDATQSSDIMSGIGSMANQAASGLLSGGLSSGAGNAIGNVGNAVGSLVGKVNPVMGAAVQVGSGIVGGITNSLFGSKLNEENIQAVKKSNSALNNAAVSHDSTASALSGFSDLDFGADFAKSDIGRDGLFSNTAANKFNELKSAQQLARGRAMSSLGSATSAIASNQASSSMASYSAFGGPLGSGGLDDDYVNEYAKGGNIHIKKANRGKFTEAAHRAGYSDVQAYARHVLNDPHASATLKKRANFARNASKWHALGGDLFASGGSVATNGANFSQGYTNIGAGGSHETNQYEGVQMGTDPEGKPNLVEEDEVVWARGDGKDPYVFSRRIPVPEEDKATFKLGKKEISFADAARKLCAGTKERPNDTIERRGQDAALERLMQAQEQVREIMRQQQEQQQQLMQILAAQQQQAYLDQMARQQMVQDQLMQMAAAQQDQGIGYAAYGGGLNLFPYGGKPVYTGDGSKSTVLPEVTVTAKRKPNVLPEVVVTAPRSSVLPELTRRTKKKPIALPEVTVTAKRKPNVLPEVVVTAKRKPNVLPEVVVTAPRKKKKKVEEKPKIIMTPDDWTHNFNDYDAEWDTRLPLIDENGQVVSEEDAGPRRLLWDDSDFADLFNAQQPGLDDLSEGSSAAAEEEIERQARKKRLFGKRLFGKKNKHSDGGTMANKFSGVTNLDEINAMKQQLDDEQEAMAQATRSVDDDENKKAGNASKGINWNKLMMLAPAYGSGLGVLTDALGITNNPDYANSRRIENAARVAAGSYQPISPRFIGDYLPYTPVDMNYEANILGAQANAARRAAMYSGVNPAAANAMLGSLNYAAQTGLGNALLAANKANFDRRKEVAEFNRGTNLANSQLDAEAQKTNQAQRMQAGKAWYEGSLAGAALRDQIEERADKARSANLTGLFNNLGNVGRHMYDVNAISTMPGNSYARDMWRGNVFFNGNNDGNGYGLLDESVFDPTKWKWRPSGSDGTGVENGTRACGGYLTMRGRKRRR